MPELFLALLGVGLLAGFLGGLLGIGGGVVIVPALIVLYEAEGLLPASLVTVVAVATSLACIVFTSLSAAITQARAGKVLWPIFAQMAPFFVIGAFCAGLLVPWLPAGVMRVLIGVFLLFVSVVMLLDWKPAPHARLPGAGGKAGIGYLGGIAAGTAGIAGGNIIVPTLVYFNVPVHNATATSSAMGVPIALAGAAGFAIGITGEMPDSNWNLGYIDLKSWLAVTAGAIVAAPLGVRMAHRIPAASLKRLFGGLLVIVAGRMLYSALFTLNWH